MIPLREPNQWIMYDKVKAVMTDQGKKDAWITLCAQFGTLYSTHEEMQSITDKTTLRKIAFKG